MNTEATKSSLSGVFARSFSTGVKNSSLMFGIFSAVSMIATMSLALPIGFSAMAIAVVTTGIFSGVMGVKKAKDTAAHSAQTVSTTVAARSQSRDISPSLNSAPARDTAQSSWVERTGRSSTSQNHVQAILANGSMSDKDRASAILAAREQAAANSQSL